MIIKLENLTIVFKCPKCHALHCYHGDKDFISNFMMRGLQQTLCDMCDDNGELELSHFEIK